MRTHRRDNFVSDPNLALFLPLYERDGASFASKDAYGHLATVTGALWTLRGRSFDGVDDRLACNANVTKGLSAVTVMAWVNPTDMSALQAVIGDYTGAADGSLVFEIADAAATSTWGLQLWIKGQDVAAQNITSLITDRPYSQWYHTVVTWKPNTGILYVNGVLDISGGYTATTLQSVVTQNTVIGAYQDASGVENFKGLIGEVLIYNRVLSPMEIQHNYLATKWRYTP